MNDDIAARRGANAPANLKGAKEMNVNATIGREPSPLVRSVRDRINEIADRDRRRAILRALGCVELDDDYRSRRAKVPRTARGAELLAAIDALDHACLQGSDDEIEAAGGRSIDLWALCLSLPGAQ